MPFSDLGHMTLSDFIRAESGSDENFWFFQHIPKTAGSSFSNELCKRKWPYANISVDYNDMETPHDEKLARAVSMFLHSACSTTFKSASGHLKQDQVKRISQEIPNIRVVTFLRNPEARVISDFRYQRTPMHPPYQEFIERFPTIESYVESPDSQNKMANFLLGDISDISPEEAVKIIGLSHSFIGLLEMYPMSFNVIFRMMGYEGLWPVEHQRKTPDDETTKVVITPELRKSILESNGIDQAIYDYVHKTLMHHREEFLNLD